MQEDEGTKEARNQQLLAEDIDSILARAEVGRPCPPVLHLNPVPVICYLASQCSEVRYSPLSQSSSPETSQRMFYMFRLLHDPYRYRISGPGGAQRRPV